MYIVIDRLVALGVLLVNLIRLLSLGKALILFMSRKCRLFTFLRLLLAVTLFCHV